MGKIRRVILVLILILSLAGNGFLGWEVFQYQKQISGFKSETTRLTKENLVALKQLVAKDETLKAKLSELEKKQVELDKLNKNLKEKEDLLKRQESQLQTNSAELERLRSRPPLFSFQNKSSRPNIESDQAQVKEVVEAAYDYIKTVYSDPYLLHSVTITFVDTFDLEGAAGEIVLTNSDQGLSIEIRIKEFDKNNFNHVNTILHEILHSFHGVAAFEEPTIEEGITVAATDEVMRRMTVDGKLPNFGKSFLALSESRYQSLQNDASFYIPASYGVFYGSNQTFNYYQFVGRSWEKLAKAGETDFYRRFNESYYAEVRGGKKANLSLAKETIKKLISSVDGVPIETFLSTNKAFNLR